MKRSQGIALDISNIDMNDSQYFASIGTGHCEGIFQLESAGMKNFMKEAKADDSLEDIIAGIFYIAQSYGFYSEIFRGKK